MNTMNKWIPLTLPLWLLSVDVYAQSYSIDWDVIAGGGGVTSGGSYSSNSTIGEHVAGGSLAGGTYSLASGFWALRSGNARRAAADHPSVANQRCGVGL